jgi:hypothetical protein
MTEKKKLSMHNWEIRNRMKRNKQKKLIQLSIKKWLRDYKIKIGCKICGFKKYACSLDFHHSKGQKEIELSRTISLKRSLNRVKKEDKKCPPSN